MLHFSRRVTQSALWISVTVYLVKVTVLIERISLLIEAIVGSSKERTFESLKEECWISQSHAQLYVIHLFTIMQRLCEIGFVLVVDFVMV